MEINIKCPDYTSDYYGKSAKYKSAITEFKGYLTAVKEKLLQVPGLQQSLAGNQFPTPIAKTATYFRELAKKELNQKNATEEELNQTAAGRIAKAFDRMPGLMTQIDEMLTMNPAAEDRSSREYAQKWRSIQLSLNMLYTEELAQGETDISIKTSLYQMMEKPNIGYDVLSRNEVKSAFGFAGVLDDVRRYSAITREQLKVNTINVKIDDLAAKKEAVVQDEMELKVLLDKAGFRTAEELRTEKEELTGHISAMEERIAEEELNRYRYSKQYDAALRELSSAKKQLDEYDKLTDEKVAVVVDRKDAREQFLNEYPKAFEQLMAQRTELSEERGKLQNDLNFAEEEGANLSEKQKALKDKNAEIEQFVKANKLGEVVKKRDTIKKEQEPAETALTILNGPDEQKTSEACKKLFKSLEAVYQNDPQNEKTVKWMINQQTKNADENPAQVIGWFGSFKDKLTKLVNQKSAEQAQLLLGVDDVEKLTQYDVLRNEQEKLETEVAEIRSAVEAVDAKNAEMKALQQKETALIKVFNNYVNELGKKAGVEQIPEANGVLDEKEFLKKIDEAIEESQLVLGTYTQSIKEDQEHFKQVEEMAKNNLQRYDPAIIDNRIADLRKDIAESETKVKACDNMLTSFAAIRQKYLTAARTQETLLKQVNEELPEPGKKEILDTLTAFEQNAGKGYDGSHKNTPEYEGMITALQNASEIFRGDTSRDERKAALEGLQNAAQHYLDEKHGQFRPFESQMRKARLQFAEDLVTFSTSALSNLTADVANLKGYDTVEEFARNGQTMELDIDEEGLAQDMDSLKETFPAEFEAKKQALEEKLAGHANAAQNEGKELNVSVVNKKQSRVLGDNH